MDLDRWTGGLDRATGVLGVFSGDWGFTIVTPEFSGLLLPGLGCVLELNSAAGLSCCRFGDWT